MRLSKRAPASPGADVVGILFFAGHGMEVDGKNLLVPSDFHIEEGVLSGKVQLSESALKATVRGVLHILSAPAVTGRGGFVVGAGALSKSNVRRVF